MTVIDEPQGSPGWWAARRGIPTASEFKRFAKEDGTLRREQGSFEVKIPVEDAREIVAPDQVTEDYREELENLYTVD